MQLRRRAVRPGAAEECERTTVQLLDARRKGAGAQAPASVDTYRVTTRLRGGMAAAAPVVVTR